MNSFALIGSDISKSLSPRLWQFFAEETGIPLSYKLCQMRPDASDCELRTLIASYDAVNITAPFKKRVAAMFGASLPVNLVVNKPSPKTYSLDGIAAVRALTFFGVDIRGKSLLVLGAGGAAEVAISAFKERGARVMCINRTEAKARALTAKYNLENAFEHPYGILSFVNEGGKLNYPHEQIESVQFVFDANYKQHSKLLMDAERLKIKAIDGLAMLFFQGAESFALSTGKKLDDQNALLEEFLQSLKD